MQPLLKTISKRVSLCIKSNNVFNMKSNWRPFLTFDMMESSHQYPRNHLGVVMRFVSLWPGCVAGLGDMMSEREREMLWHWSWHLDTTWAGASTAWAAVTPPVLCTVLCTVQHPRLQMEEVKRMRTIPRAGAEADLRGMMDVVRGWSD